MSWESGQRYRFRAVPGQVQVEKNPKSGTPSVQIMCEVTAGPQLAQRMRWRGYLNTQKNGETAVAEMRVMGWRGLKLGDWSGFGTTEFEATALSETGGDGKTYWRIAWPRPVATLKADKAVKADELGALNASLGALLGKPVEPAVAAAGLPPAPTPSDGGEGGGDEIPF